MATRLKHQSLDRGCMLEITLPGKKMPRQEYYLRIPSYYSLAIHPGFDYTGAATHIFPFTASFHLG